MRTALSLIVIALIAYYVWNWWGSHVTVNLQPADESAWQEGSTTQPAPETGGTAQVANPASVNCVNKGGTLEMREETGGTAGYCHLPSGTVCEEWALFRGTCASS